MTDFSFQNKAYDLLINLAEDKVTKQLPKINSIKDLRLLIDIIKDQFPIYKNADNATIAEFIKDMFKVTPSMQLMNTANHTEEECYRHVSPIDIKPGAVFKMIGTHVDYKGKKHEHYYFHTFPTKELSLRQYAHQYKIIWDKAIKNKAFIKNTYKFKIGDEVSCNGDPSSRGIIKSRIPGNRPYPLTDPYIFIPNSYIVSWYNLGIIPEISLQSWYEEDWLKLVQTKKLEAKPMKTFDINKRKITIQYEIFSPKKWLEENIKKGYDKVIYQTLLQRNTERREFGWITEQKFIEIGKDTLNTLNTVRNKLKHTYHIKLNNIKNLKIISDDNIIKHKKHTTKKHKVDTTFTPRPQTYRVKLTPKEINDYKLINGKEPQTYYRTQLNKPNNRLVCVKYVIPGENGIKTVTRIPLNEAEELIKNHSNYDYATKKEWREYCALVENKKKKGLTTMGTDAASGIQMPRRSRRYNPKKHNKGSRLVKEQIVPKIIPEQEIEVNSINPTLHKYDENGNIIGKERLHYKYIKPAHIILKRIFTRVEAWKPVKITKDILLQRKEQSERDKIKYLNKKNKKSINELKEIFNTEERRWTKNSKIETWSNNFNRLVKLITTGNKYTDGDKTVYINKKGLFYMVSNIINIDSKLHWDNEQIKDFIRYIRLTTHGIFTKDKKEKVNRPLNSKKLCKAKHPKKNIEFEPSIIIPVVDISKLKHNLPDENKQVIVLFNNKDTNTEIEGEGIFKENNIIHESGDIICSINTVTKWKYPNDTEFRDILIDEGGGIRQVPIKFKRKK